MLTGKIRQLRLTLEKFLDICLAGIYMIDSSTSCLYQKRYNHGEKETYFHYQLLDVLFRAFCRYTGSFIRHDARLKGNAHADFILYDSRDISNYVLIEFAANLPKGHPNDGIEGSHSTVYGCLNQLCLKYSQHDIVFPSQTTGAAPRTLKAECCKMWFIYFFHDYLRLKEVVDIFAGKNCIDTYNDLNVLLCYWNPEKENHLETHFKKSRGMAFISCSHKNNGWKSVESGAIKRSGDGIVEEEPSKKKKVEIVYCQ